MGRSCALVGTGVLGVAVGGFWHQALVLSVLSRGRHPGHVLQSDTEVCSGGLPGYNVSLAVLFLAVSHRFYNLPNILSILGIFIIPFCLYSQVYLSFATLP